MSNHSFEPVAPEGGVFFEASRWLPSPPGLPPPRALMHLSSRMAIRGSRPVSPAESPLRGSRCSSHISVPSQLTETLKVFELLFVAQALMTVPLVQDIFTD